MIGKVEGKKESFVKYAQTHSLEATAKHFNIGIAYAQRLRKEWCGIVVKRKSKAPSKEEFAEYKKNHTLQQCADHFKISRVTAFTYTKKYNLPCYHGRADDWILNGHNITKEFPEYAKTHTSKECAEYFKVSPGTIHNWCSKYKVRPMAKQKTYKVEARKLYIVYKEDDIKYFTNIQDIAMFFGYTNCYTSTLLNRDKQIKDYNIVITDITTYRHLGELSR